MDFCGLVIATKKMVVHVMFYSTTVHNQPLAPESHAGEGGD